MTVPPKYLRPLPDVDISERGLRQLEIWLRQRSQLEWEDVGVGITSSGSPAPANVSRKHRKVKFGDGLAVIDEGKSVIRIDATIGDTSAGDSIEDIILAKSAVGLWKLDETSGTTAADSSGAGNDMTVPNGGFSYTAPTWGQAAGPPGTTAALFDTAVGVTSGARLAVTMPVGMTDDFSAGAWVRVNDTGLGPELLGQGLAWHASGGGWTLAYDTVTGKFALKIGAFGYPIVHANNVSAIGAWYLFGVSRIAGTWKLYLDGLEQTATSIATPTAETATWLGDCGLSSPNHGSRQTISWAFITDTPLDGADWAALNDAATTGGALAANLVWTSNGAGGASWDAPTIEVEF